MSPRPQNDVNQCGAEITQVYNDMLLDPAALDIDQAEAVLDECAATLDKSLPKKDDLNLLDSTPYCPSPAPSTSPGASGRRRQLSHAEGDPIEASINYTYAECFADHALATPCVGSSPPPPPPPACPSPNAFLPVENVCGYSGRTAHPSAAHRAPSSARTHAPLSTATVARWSARPRT
eukprot:COSAG01_NODE_946_length_12533_cov_4.570532_15_plen_178_part_00